MAVRLNGEELEVAEGLTFAELIEYVRGLLDHQALVEMRLNRETVSQSLLEELRDQPIYGEIEFFSLDVHGLVAEVVKQALRYLDRLEGQKIGPEDLPQLLEGFEWLNRALVLIPLGVGFPELRARVERLLEGNRLLRERLSRSPEGLAEMEPRLWEELAAYRAVFCEIRDRL
jgi:sulfur carrier protein ThiS